MTFLEPARSLVAAHQGAVGSFEVERRRLVVGINHHIVGAELPRLLKQVNSSEPGVVMEMRISTSRDLVAAYDRGELMQPWSCVTTIAAMAARSSWKKTLAGWVCADFEHHAGEPLRLATQPAPCSVRSMAVDALDGAGVARTEVFVGDGISTVGAAISAGLAIAALGRRSGTDGHGRSECKAQSSAAAQPRYRPLYERIGPAGPQFAADACCRDPIDCGLKLDTIVDGSIFPPDRLRPTPGRTPPSKAGKPSASHHSRATTRLRVHRPRPKRSPGEQVNDVVSADRDRRDDHQAIPQQRQRETASDARHKQTQSSARGRCGMMET